MPDKSLRLLGEGGALVQHGLDPLAQRTNAPPLDTAHLRIEVALK